MPSNHETITGIDLLVKNEYLVYVVWVGWTFAERVPNHLEYVFQTVGIVDVNVSNPILSVRKKG